MSISPDGGLLMAAQYSGKIDFGGGLTDYIALRDVAIVKFDPMGKERWTRTLNSPSNLWIADIAADPAGNVIAVGGLEGADLVMAGRDYKRAKEALDGFITKLDVSGKPQWLRVMGSEQDDILSSVATDQFGNIWVTGFFWFAVDLFGIELRSAGSKDILFAKLNPMGKAMWAHRFGSEDHDRGRSVFVGPNGLVALTGTFRFDIKMGETVLNSRRKKSEAFPFGDAFLALFEP